MLELLWYWIRQRELMRMRKEEGALGDLSPDPILRDHHFCNVRREDDRVTKELRALAFYYVEDENDLPAFYTMARMLNRAVSVEVVVRWGWGELKFRRDRGDKIFHTAYVVSTCGKRMDKIDYVQSVVEEVAELEVPLTTLHDAFQALRSIDGLGSFMAGQIVADLKNDRYLTEAKDWFSWASMGPGSQKGMNYIYPGTTERNFIERLHGLYGEMPKDIADMELHAQDLQNCLCELSKYIRYMKGGAGRVRLYHSK